MADYLTEHHNAKILFIDSRTFKRNKILQNWGIVKAVLESYWDYAEGGCTYMYRLRKDRNISDMIDDEDGAFEKFEISKEEIDYQKTAYEELARKMTISCGEKSFSKIVKAIEEDHNKR